MTPDPQFPTKMSVAPFQIPFRSLFFRLHAESSFAGARTCVFSSQNSSKMKNAIGWMFVLMVTAAGCGRQGGGEGPATAFRTMTVTRSDLTLSQEYPASIEGRQSIRMIPRVEGYLQQVHIREGQHVRRGELLFTIDQAPYRAEVKAAEANVAVAEAGVAEAQLNYESRRKLWEKEIVSDYDLESASIRLKTARAQLLQSRAQLETAENNLSYTELRSPSDGIVGSLPYRTGDYVGPSMQGELTRVADNAEMYVYFSLTERDVLERIQMQGAFDKVVATFPPVSLRLSDGRVYPLRGRVESLSGIVGKGTGALSARAVFPNPDGVLLSGSTGSLIVPEHYEQAIVIPKAATYEVMDKVHAWRVIDGEARSVIVQVQPASDGNSYVVTEGLTEGDLIVAEGAGYVREGMKINIDKPTEP